MKRAVVIACSLLFTVSFLWSLYHVHSSTVLRPISDFFWPNKASKVSEASETHTVITSATTTNGAFFKIECGDRLCMNPNILPHPYLDYTFIIVAQEDHETGDFIELFCNAQFANDTLRCITPANALPIEATTGDKCIGDLAWIGASRGPHDARAFLGPRNPFIIFGSNSKFACFGLWLQDFRSLIEWPFDDFEINSFTTGTELQRPLPWGKMEKNWFLFFDEQDQAYVHHDISPKRVFSKLESDGSVGPDLAVLTADHDQACMAKYMPEVGPTLESVHQATNSLSITMCKRYDPDCSPNSSNTFVFTIFQHKSYFNYHALYEPYVMIFEQRAPFQLHSFSDKPIWIQGRTGSVKQGQEEEGEMLYVTSISWKHPSQKYHGFIDDTLFIGFGIEDHEAGAIDIIASDILGPDVIEIC